MMPRQIIIGKPVLLGKNMAASKNSAKKIIKNSAKNIVTIRWISLSC